MVQLNNIQQMSIYIIKKKAKRGILNKGLTILQNHNFHIFVGLDWNRNDNILF